MRTRTLSGRNWLGGFLCGFIGILTMGFLHEALAPVGGFVGFIVGFRYEKIVAGATAYWRVTTRRMVKRWNRLKIIAITPEHGSSRR